MNSTTLIGEDLQYQGLTATGRAIIFQRGRGGGATLGSEATERGKGDSTSHGREISENSFFYSNQQGGGGVLALVPRSYASNSGTATICQRGAKARERSDQAGGGRFPPPTVGRFLKIRDFYETVFSCALNSIIEGSLCSGIDQFPTLLPTDQQGGIAPLCPPYSYASADCLPPLCPLFNQITLYRTNKCYNLLSCSHAQTAYLERVGAGAARRGAFNASSR